MHARLREAAFAVTVFTGLLLALMVGAVAIVDLLKRVI